MVARSFQDRIRVIDLRNQGRRPQQIIDATGFEKRFVFRWCRAADNGRDASDQPRSGRPRKLTPAVVRIVRAHMKGRKGRSSRKVARIMEARHQVRLSASSVQRAAKLAGLRPYRRPKKPLLTDAMRERRLDFAERYRETDWRHVLFSDETTLVLFGEPNRRNNVIWEESAENVSPTQAPKHPSKVHVWGAVSYYGKTDLFIFEEVLDADLYVRILQSRLEGVEDIFPGRIWMFQQDGDPKHTSKKATKWLDENVPSYIPKYDWPPNSPDANIIEPVWAMLKEKVYSREPRTVLALKRMIREEWNNIKLETVRQLVDSMPARLAAIVAAEGGHTSF
jgi:transposase